jgi:ATP-dependent Clp protease ATP-binding subunit ClpC
MPTQGYNFTENVRKVLANARSEAVRLHHEYVGTEHILLAIARTTEGVASVVLNGLDVDRDKVIADVESAVQRGHAHASGDVGHDLPYTSRAKKTLELATAEARALSHGYVGTEHLLLGLIAEDRGIGAQILKSAGVTLERARAETVARLTSDVSGSAVPGAQPPHPASPGYARTRGPYGVALVDDFTGRARDALRAAYEEANSRDHASVELSHVLLALASREDGMAAVMLDQVVGSRKRVVEALVERLPDKENTTDRRPLTLSADTQQALDNALIEASKDGHRRAGTQHLLLAVLDVLPLALAAACAQMGLSAKAARLVYERMRE